MGVLPGGGAHFLASVLLGQVPSVEDLTWRALCLLSGATGALAGVYEALAALWETLARA